jgi:protease-4
VIKRFLAGIWRTITLVRLALANLLFLALIVVIWGLLSDKPEPLPERAALILNPQGRVVDERSGVEAAAFLVEADAVQRETLLADLIDSVKHAIEDPRIVALVLDLGDLISIGQSRSLELGAAVQRFRESGKPVVAVGDYFTQDQYRLAVEADTLLMHPFGGVALEGYAYYLNFFAEALAKLSVSMHVFRAGEYKSIAEPLLRNDMSEGERRVATAWLGDLWANYSSTVETRRGLAAGSLQDLLDNYPEYLGRHRGNTAKLALDTGLVDDLLDRSQQNAYLAALVGARDEADRYQGIDFRDYLPRVRQAMESPKMANVAVVTAEGNIVPGNQPPGSIGGDSLARLLRSTAERDGTRAIVLRINSGGGSVFASELIREEMARIRDAGTPIVVSMGSVAASGGYYIATAADRIVATPATLTGSIGVFLAFPTFENLLERGGISTDGVGTTAMAGTLRLDRPLSPELAAVMQQTVDDLYERFLGLVMESRGLERAEVDAVAQGRVLSARAALDAGLIDELGGLDEAITAAAGLAGLAEGDFEILSIQPQLSPRQQFLQQLSEAMGFSLTGNGGVAGALLRAPLLRQWLGPVQQSAEALAEFSDPRHLYMRCLSCGT